MHQKIISNELAGVFNWVLDGLKRLLLNKKFTNCNAIEETLERYKTESDSAQMFLIENNYHQSNTDRMRLSDLYQHYRSFCNDDGYRACGIRVFSDRLRRKGFDVIKSGDRYVYIEKVA